jgi:translation initiation factor 1A
MYQTSIRNKKKHIKFQHNKDPEYIVDNDYEEYAYVIKMLGNCRVEVVSNSGLKSIGIIRGSMRKFSKRILIEKGDIIVISKRDYQQGKVDIIHKFNNEQTQALITEQKLSTFLINVYSNKKSLNEDNINNITDDTGFLENLVFDENHNDNDNDNDNDIIELNNNIKNMNMNNDNDIYNNSDDYSSISDKSDIDDINDI